MVKEIRIDKKAVFLCEECGLGYAGKETAQRCEKWCNETKSCSLEITRKAIYFPYFLYQKRTHKWTGNFVQEGDRADE